MQSGSSKTTPIYFFSSVRADSGKTTIVTNLAVYLNSLGYKVAILDFDYIFPQKINKLLEDKYEVKEYQELSSLAVAEAPRFQNNFSFTETNKLSLFPAQKVKTPAKLFADAALKDFFFQLSNIFDYILVNLTPGLNESVVLSDLLAKSYLWRGCRPASIIVSLTDEKSLINLDSFIQNNQIISYQSEENTYFVFNKVPDSEGFLRADEGLLDISEVRTLFNYPLTYVFPHINDLEEQKDNPSFYVLQRESVANQYFVGLFRVLSGSASISFLMREANTYRSCISGSLLSRIFPYIEKMQQMVAAKLFIDVADVNVYLEQNDQNFRIRVRLTSTGQKLLGIRSDIPDYQKLKFTGIDSPSSFDSTSLKDKFRAVGQMDREVTYALSFKSIFTFDDSFYSKTETAINKNIPIIPIKESFPSPLIFEFANRIPEIPTLSNILGLLGERKYIGFLETEDETNKNGVTPVYIPTELELSYNTDAKNETKFLCNHNYVLATTYIDNAVLIVKSYDFLYKKFEPYKIFDIFARNKNFEFISDYGLRQDYFEYSCDGIQTLPKGQFSLFDDNFIGSKSNYKAFKEDTEDITDQAISKFKLDFNNSFDVDLNTTWLSYEKKYAVLSPKEYQQDSITNKKPEAFEKTSEFKFFTPGIKFTINCESYFEKINLNNKTTINTDSSDTFSLDKYDIEIPLKLFKEGFLSKNFRPLPVSINLEDVMLDYDYIIQVARAKDDYFFDVRFLKGNEYNPQFNCKFEHKYMEPDLLIRRRYSNQRPALYQLFKLGKLKVSNKVIVAKMEYKIAYNEIFPVIFFPKAIEITLSKCPPLPDLINIKRDYDTEQNHLKLFIRPLKLLTYHDVPYNTQIHQKAHHFSRFFDIDFDSLKVNMRVKNTDKPEFLKNYLKYMSLPLVGAEIVKGIDIENTVALKNDSNLNIDSTFDAEIAPPDIYIEKIRYRTEKFVGYSWKKPSPEIITFKTYIKELTPLKIQSFIHHTFGTIGDVETHRVSKYPLRIKKLEMVYNVTDLSKCKPVFDYDLQFTQSPLSLFVYNGNCQRLENIIIEKEFEQKYIVPQIVSKYILKKLATKLPSPKLNRSRFYVIPEKASDVLYKHLLWLFSNSSGPTLCEYNDKISQNYYDQNDSFNVNYEFTPICGELEFKNHDDLTLKLNKSFVRKVYTIKNNHIRDLLALAKAQAARASELVNNQNLAGNYFRFMGFIFSKNSDSPVFDIPQIDIYKTEFVDRRIATIVARSVLSEKNQPTKPSTDYKFRKCYSDYVRNLYKYDYQPQEVSKIIINYRNLSKEESDYCMPLAYYYHYRKLRQKSIFYLINTNLSPDINLQKTEYNEDLSDISFAKSFSYYSNHLKIESHILYKDNDFNFRFQIYEKYTKNIFLPKKSISAITKGIFNFDCAINNHFLNNLENYLIPTFLYDFTKFSSESRESMKELGLEADLKPIDSLKKIKSKYDICSKQKLAFTTHYLDKFQQIVKVKVEEIEALEIFGKFFLTAPKKLLPYENGVGINNEVIFSSDISSFISNPNKIQWDFRNYIASIPEKYENIKNDNTFSKLALEHCSEFKHNINTDWFKILPFKHPILSGRKPLSVLLRYRAPRLALKLTILRPRFFKPNLDYTIKYNKKIKTDIIIKQTKFIKANFNRVVFNHKSPVVFKNNINEDSLDLKNRFKQRKSSFLSKSPRHSRYSYKLLHKILSDYSFRMSKRIKIRPDSYISQNNKLKKLRSSQIEYLYNFFKIEIIDFVQKPVNNRIDIERSNVKQIVCSSKFMALKKIKEPIDKQIERKRIGLNYLKTLQAILLTGLNNTETYSSNFLKPRKKINPIRNNEQIKKGLFNLLVLKNIDELFNRQTNALDFFKIKYQNKQYDYYPYLPKQIVDSFALDFKIIGVKEVDALSQKNIVPPPGWKKISKIFDCKLKLGPYPFGFPAFFIAAPVFNVLTTRRKYSIKDVVIDSLFGESLFILKKDKLYLPELSMKQPRRLLFSEITPKNSPKEYYRAKPEAKKLEQDQPKKISSFDYSWLIDNLMNQITKRIKSFLLNEKLKVKHYFLGRMKYFDSFICLTPNYLPDVIKTDMPRVSSLSLKADLLKTANIIGKIQENGFINSFNKYFTIGKFVLTKPIFKIKNLLCSMKMPMEWTIPQIIKSVYPASEPVPQYITRFRSFHFPYIPDFPEEPLEKASFGNEIDYASLYTCKFQEDFRVSQFDFGPFELQSLFEDQNEYDVRFVSKLSGAFSIESQYIVTNAVNKYIYSSNYNFKFNTFKTPKYYQHLITPRFFRIKETLIYKYKRRGKTIQNLKYLTFAKLLPEGFSNFASKMVDSMDSPSFHWIIMLRKNNSVKVSYKYVLESNLSLKEEPSVCFYFEKFEKDNYLDYFCIKPIIKDLTRYNFVQKEKQSPMTISYKYDCDMLNRDRRLKSFLYSLINGKILKSQLSEKKFWISTLPSNLQPLAKTYDYISSNNSIEDSEFDDSKDKGTNGAKKVTKKFLKQDDSRKAKIIELDKNIEKLPKSKLSLSAIIGNKEELSFRIGVMKDSMKVAYRPFYMPDFIDIQIEGNTNKNLRIRE